MQSSIQVRLLTVDVMAEMMRAFSEPSSHAGVAVWFELCSRRSASHGFLH